MKPKQYVVFEAHGAGECLLALRDTFGPRLAQEALLLFTDDGKQGKWIDRSAVLELEPAASWEGPFRVIIKAADAAGARSRLSLMAGPLHGYGWPPALVEEEDIEPFLTDPTAYIDFGSWT